MRLPYRSSHLLFLVDKSHIETQSLKSSLWPKAHANTLVSWIKMAAYKQLLPRFLKLALWQHRYNVIGKRGVRFHTLCMRTLSFASHRSQGCSHAPPKLTASTQREEYIQYSTYRHGHPEWRAWFYGIPHTWPRNYIHYILLAGILASCLSCNSTFH